MLRFLHCADVHLGLRVTRFRPEVLGHLREARFQALQKLRDLAADRTHGFRFVIIAGDLFDDSAVSTAIARQALHLLDSFPVPVLITTGNHDPLQDGSVWDADPWRPLRDGGRSPDGHVRLLTERTPVEVLPGVTVFPCPVFRKTSHENPTEWIASHVRDDRSQYRIGIAHGSVRIDDRIPDDDHPLPIDTPQRADLDYLALGHWHRLRMFPDADGRCRMAYPGVPEPMRFTSDRGASGWRETGARGAAEGTRDEFLDTGDGLVLAVSIDEPGGPTRIEPHSVRHLTWVERTELVTSIAQLGSLIDAVASAATKERTLLRLDVEGTLSLKGIAQVEDLRHKLGSYLYAELDTSELATEAPAEELETRLGGGLLRQVYDELNAVETLSARPGLRDHVLRVLSRLVASA